MAFAIPLSRNAYPHGTSEAQPGTNPPFKHAQGMQWTKRDFGGTPRRSWSLSIDMEKVRVGAIGGGAFGTSLCVHCSRAGHETLIYTRDEGVKSDINDPDVKENKVYFKVRAHLCYDTAPAQPMSQF